MNRRSFLAGAAASLYAADRPNIVFIISDDHHYQCLGAAGNPHIHTPNLDGLAKHGILFSNAAISTAQCAPSRGVLLSGMETFQTGLTSNGATSFRPGFGPTVVEQLRKSGYETAVIGKWHVKNRPAECGFAVAPVWLPGGGSRYVNPELVRGLEGSRETIAGHITDIFTDAAIQYVSGAKRPYFLWLAYNAPHTPWTALPKHLERYEGKPDLAPPAHPKDAKKFDWKTYYAVISHLDEAIGRLVAKIDLKNTIVVFLGDNGYLCGTKGLNGKVHPWEESVRVPMIAAGGPVTRGVRHEDPVASVDLPATFLDIASAKPQHPLSGRSLKKLLTEGKGGPTDAFSVWDDPREEALSIRVAVEPYRLVRTRRHKLIVWESGKQALFDHVADRGEEKDLIADTNYASVLADLRKRLAARMRATNDRALAWLNAASPASRTPQ